MTIYDQHVHTSLSYDCSELFENYLDIAVQNGYSHFVTTEHLDLSCCLTGKDMLVDFSRQNSKLEELQSKYAINILKGVEMGYKFSRIHAMQNILEKENFDVVIMAVHEDELADCTTQGFLYGKSPDEAYDRYLDLYLCQLTHCDCYDIVGHIDYLLRYIEKVDIEKHKEKLRMLLQLVIEKEKSLEFNTRFLYQHKNSAYLSYIFQLYHKLGGRKISLGSDSHTYNTFAGEFSEAVNILKSIGFIHNYAYIKRQENTISL